jgi:CheY-like chemotaxis protein
MNAGHQPFPVLVVDDSPVARKLVEQVLPPEQYTLLPAKTVSEALDLFALHRPGLSATRDVRMESDQIERDGHRPLDPSRGLRNRRVEGLK